MIDEKVVFGFRLGEWSIRLLGAFAVWLAAISAYALIILRVVPLSSVLLLLIVLGFFLRFESYDVRSALFYDDRIEIVGKKYRVKLDYAKISAVSKAKVLPLFTFRTQVCINVEGKEKPYVIPWNQGNRRLKTDLYSWLVHKTRQLAEQPKSTAEHG